MDMTTSQTRRNRVRGPYRQGLSLPQPVDRVLRARETASLIGLCVNSIQRRAKNGGDLPKWFRHGTGKNSPICFRLSDVSAWVAAR